MRVGFCDYCGKTLKDERLNCCRSCRSNLRKQATDSKYIGQKFGMLTIIERYDSKDTKYICQCDCGNTSVARPSALMSSETISCGCHRRLVGKKMATVNGLGQRSDIVGQKFGRLLVLEFAGLTDKGATLFLCQCDCGNQKVIRAKSILAKSAKSCGCLHREAAAENLRRARFKHGLSNNKAYLNWRKRARYKDAKGWTYQMEAALRNLQPTCVLCNNSDNLCVDHVFPFSKGGELVPGNVVTLCRACNISKIDKLLTDLPDDVAQKISDAAYDFAQYWQNVEKTMVT